MNDEVSAWERLMKIKNCDLMVNLRVPERRRTRASLANQRIIERKGEDAIIYACTIREIIIASERWPLVELMYVVACME